MSTANVPREKQWVETADKVTGLVYFYNRGTRESSWTRPTGDDIMIIVRRDRETKAKAKGGTKATAKATTRASSKAAATKENKQQQNHQQLQRQVSPL